MHWGGEKGQPRFCDDLVAGYTGHILRLGGVMTWDVPAYGDGTIPDGFLNQLIALKGV